jgi:hypothetical protein
MSPSFLMRLVKENAAEKELVGGCTLEDTKEGMKHYASHVVGKDWVGASSMPHVEWSPP